MKFFWIISPLGKFTLSSFHSPQIPFIYNKHKFIEILCKICHLVSRQSVSTSMCQYVNVSKCQCINVSMCQCVNVSMCQSVKLSVCKSVSASLPVCESVSLWVCQSVSLSVYQSVSLPVCESVSLSVFKSINLFIQRFPVWLIFELVLEHAIQYSILTILLLYSFPLSSVTIKLSTLGFSSFLHCKIKIFTFWIYSNSEIKLKLKQAILMCYGTFNGSRL